MTAYRALPDLMRMGPGSGTTILSYSPFTRRAYTIDEIDWAALGQCLVAAPIEQHAARLSQNPRFSDAESRLARLVLDELLLPEAALDPFQGRDTAVDTAATITHVGIPTRGRPALLRRCVESWLAATHGRDVAFVIACDGRTAAESAPNRAVMAELARERKARILYCGHAERAAYAPRLAREAGVAEELVRFALLCESPALFGEGSSRNAILLSAAGNGIVMVDDDTICRFTSSPERRDELEICAYDPYTPWFPEPGGSARDLAAAEDLEPCTLLERLLGRNISRLAAEMPSRWASCPGLLLRNLREHGGAVAGVMCGILGDTATGSVAHYLLFGGAARARLMKSQGVYDHAISSRQVLMTPTQWVVTEASRCMTYLLALDAREILPPFMPIGRNCDGLFGVVLRRSCREAYFGHVPWAIEHDTVPRPSSRELLIDTAPIIYGLDLLIRLIHQMALDPLAADRTTGMGSLGMRLRHLAAMPQDDFDEAARVALLNTRTHDLTIVESALATFRETPSFWATDLRAVADRIRRVILLPEHAHPHDLMTNRDGPGALTFLREQTARYGELLEAWPAIWAAANQLHEAGDMLAQPI